MRAQNQARQSKTSTFWIYSLASCCQ